MRAPDSESAIHFHLWSCWGRASGLRQRTDCRAEALPHISGAEPQASTGSRSLVPEPKAQSLAPSTCSAYRPVVLCRRASYRMIPAATATFNDSTGDCIGMVSRVSAASTSACGRPVPSAPSEHGARPVERHALQRDAVECRRDDAQAAIAACARAPRPRRAARGPAAGTRCPSRRAAPSSRMGRQTRRPRSHQSLRLPPPRARSRRRCRDPARPRQRRPAPDRPRRTLVQRPRVPSCECDHAPTGVRAGLIASATRSATSTTRDIRRRAPRTGCATVLSAERRVGERRRLDGPAGAMRPRPRAWRPRRARARSAGGLAGGLAEACDERILTAGDAGGRLGRHGVIAWQQAGSG